MLPGASEDLIEKQASILMHLPEKGLDETLLNQERLAMALAKAAEDLADKSMDEEEKKEKE